MPNRHVNISLSEALDDHLRAQARTLDMPYSSFVRAALDGMVKTGQILRCVTAGTEGKTIRAIPKPQLPWKMETPGSRAGGRFKPGRWIYKQWILERRENVWWLVKTGSYHEAIDRNMLTTNRPEAMRLATELIMKEEAEGA